MIYNNVITYKFKRKTKNCINFVIQLIQKACYYKVIKLCNYIGITSLILLPFSVSAIELQAPVTQATYVYGKVAPDEQIFIGKTEIKTTKDGLFVFGLPQDTEKELILTSQKNGQTKTWKMPIAPRKFKEEVVNGLPPHKVSPSKEDQKRIATDNKALRTARSETSYETLPFCFSRPVDKNARISSTFGARRVLNGVKTSGHSGTDYALPAGTPILSPQDGIVRLAHDDMFFSGKTILIDHGYGLFSSYSHLSKIDVKNGQTLKRGDKIGEIGTTGRSTGPHLHLTFTWFGVRVDPEFVLTTYPCVDEKE